MLGVHELLKMKGLETATFEGALAMLAAFVLTFTGSRTTFPYPLPADGNMIAYGLQCLDSNGNNCFPLRITIMRDVVYPIASSFYVGLGFHSLVDARIAGIDKVLLALFIVWATDSGAYPGKSSLGNVAHAYRFLPIKRWKVA